MIYSAHKDHPEGSILIADSHMKCTAFENDGVLCHPKPRCEACGGVGEVLHRDLRDTEFGAPGIWSTRRCADKRCGLGWLDPQPEPSELGRFYERYYTHAEEYAELPPIGTHAAEGWRAAAKKALALAMPWRRTAILSDSRFLDVLEPGRMLDVGCGTGAFVAWMAQRGWQAHGIDFDEKAVATARMYPGVTADVGDLHSQKFPDDHFDAVTLSNVIEHVPNPPEVFAECRRILKPGGRLVMMTPNLNAEGHRIFGRYWRGLEPPRHLFLFTPGSMRAIARRAGFRRMAIFTSPATSHASAFILGSSEEAAESAGMHIRVNRKRVVTKERLLELVGIRRGEWVTIVATKDR